MSAPRRLAILHDSPDFGGHERAFLTWLPALLDSPDIAELHIQFPQANAAFHAALAEAAHPKLRLWPSVYEKQRAEPYRAPFRIAYGRVAAKFVADHGADLVLMLQGRIENLATPMLWLPRKLEVVSYLPMAHTGVEMGRSAALSGFTDTVKRFYYARPQRMIVPSNAVAAQARRAGASGPVLVVENAPAPLAPAPLEPNRLGRDQARAALGLASQGRIALFMGRFDSHQKGLDHLLRDLERDKDRLGDWTFLFVGQGPAETDIRAVLQGGVNGTVVGWTPHPDRYLAASDILVAPSRYEGVPLVMLEALQRELPILASDIDVYREYLPAFALRDFTSPVDLPVALAALTSPDRESAYRQHAAGLRDRLDIATSQRRFLQALLGQVEGAASPAAVDPRRTVSS